ncbi:30711_t:CDS:2, partial [Racocetra persica]
MIQTTQNISATPITQTQIIKEIVIPYSSLANASAQKQAEEQEDLMNQIQQLKQNLSNEDKCVKHLKNQVKNRHKSVKKGNDLIKEQQIVIKYNKPSFLQKHSDLLDCIHKSIEFRTADKKRRREVMKVKTGNNLADDLRKHYNEYISRTTVNNYLLLSWSNLIAAKAHHHPAYIAVSNVFQTDT